MGAPRALVFPTAGQGERSSGNEIDIPKEDCIAHVKKRMGTALRKLTATHKGEQIIDSLWTDTYLTFCIGVAKTIVDFTLRIMSLDYLIEMVHMTPLYTTCFVDRTLLS